MGDSIREKGLTDGIIQTEWMPDWYMGDPMRVYYPPLSTWVLGLLTAITGNAITAYRLAITAIWLILGLSVYIIGVKWGRNHWLAAAGALLSVTAPFAIHTVFVEGNLPRGLALLIFPWLIWQTELILTKKSVQGNFATLAVLWALAILAHVMQAAMFAVVIGLYIAFRVMSEVYIPLRRGLLALITVGFGGGLAAMYIIPAYGRFELHNVPSLPGDKIDLFSITPAAILPYHANIEQISLGLAAILLTLIITFYRSQSHHKTLFGLGILCVIFAFGPSGGLFYLIPLNQSMLPERFLNASAILFALLIATLPRGYAYQRWILAGVALVLMIDFAPASRAIYMRDLPPDEYQLAQQLNDADLPGRAMPLTFPDPTATQNYLIGEIGGRASVSGWALENTPHQAIVRRLLAALDRSPAYLERTLALWNADYLLTRFERSSQEEQTRSELSFAIIAQSGDFSLWERTAPSAFIRELPDNRMLIIGDNATSWLFAFPFASEGVFADPAAYTAEYLDHYTVIGLNRLPDSANIEDALQSWVAAGNTLIVDLSGMGSAYQTGFNLFDVHAISLGLNGDYSITWPQELDTMPSSLPFTTPEGPWIGATYYGEMITVASLNHQNQDYPLLGYRDLGDGRIWFIGFNLLFLLDETDLRDASQTLVDYLLDESNVNRDLTLPRVDVEFHARTPDSITFSYDHPSEIRAVVSMTYFPRWQATINNEPVEIHNHEHLILLDLPAGAYSVTLDYQPFNSPALWLGWSVTLIFTALTGAAVYYLKRNPVVSFDDRAHGLDDHLLQTTVPANSDFVYSPCPNCHFPFAIQGPPNEKTYPFFSMECLICGFALDHQGLIQGEAIQNIKRDEMVREWLVRYGLTEEQLLALFEVESIDDLFKEDVRLPAFFEQLQNYQDD